ncbi:MAG: ribosomal protein S19 family protein, partial [Candidatus Atribacteria bacterium]|nr:ribosomal protein S19 family protein [Candidatus Atribacteria bacterium]
MSRSLKKGPYIDEKLLNKIKELNRKRIKSIIKTWSRSSTIFPLMV